MSGLAGECFEVAVEDVDYTAIVATDSDFLLGRVRIEPPFQASDQFFEKHGAGDIGVGLEHEVTTREATILSFNAVEAWDGKEKEEVIEAVRYTVSSVLEELGKAASKSFFLKEYGILTDER